MALKVGILGAGHMGHVHANILSKDERVQIVGVADILAKERDELANRIGSKSFPDLVDWGILMRFEKGRIATLSSSGHASWQIPTERVELVGDHSTLITEELDNVIYSKGLRQSSISMDFSQLPYDEKWGYVQENDWFLNTILNEAEPAFSVMDGLKIVQLIEECYKSVESGKTISLKREMKE